MQRDLDLAFIKLHSLLHATEEPGHGMGPMPSLA